MGNRITEEQKNIALIAIRQYGTNIAGAKAAGVDRSTINEEMNRSVRFKREVLAAREEGKLNLGDSKIQFINDVAEGSIEVKMPRLTAALAIANWSVPGFRGANKTEVSGEIDFAFKTAIPRPKYPKYIDATEVKVVNTTPAFKQLKVGNRAIKITSSKNKDAANKGTIHNDNPFIEVIARGAKHSLDG